MVVKKKKTERRALLLLLFNTCTHGLLHHLAGSTILVRLFGQRIFLCVHRVEPWPAFNAVHSRQWDTGDRGEIDKRIFDCQKKKISEDGTFFLTETPKNFHSYIYLTSRIICKYV